MFNMIWLFRFSGLVLMVPVEMHVGNQNVMFQSCPLRPLKKGKCHLMMRNAERLTRKMLEIDNTIRIYTFVFTRILVRTN